MKYIHNSINFLPKVSWWPVGNPLRKSSTSTSLPTNCSPNLDTAWQVARPCNITLLIDSSWQRGDWTGPNMGWFSLSIRTSWTPMKSRPLFVSVPVLSKQKTLIFPAIAILLELRQNMPLFCTKMETKQEKWTSRTTWDTNQAAYKASKCNWWKEDIIAIVAHT